MIVINQQAISVVCTIMGTRAMLPICDPPTVVTTEEDRSSLLPNELDTAWLGMCSLWWGLNP